jgi:hypothetical protein
VTHQFSTSAEFLGSTGSLALVQSG